MGAYLSEPKTTKDSLDSDGVYVRCGASSMQGWRISQEVSCVSTILLCSLICLTRVAKFCDTFHLAY